MHSSFYKVMPAGCDVCLRGIAGMQKDAEPGVCQIATILHLSSLKSMPDVAHHRDMQGSSTVATEI